MHFQLLVPHPACSAPPGVQVSVAWARPQPDRLMIEYHVDDPDDQVLWPQPIAGRTDGLWQHSCFEAFVASGSGTRYAEFNLSPSGAWAAYGFEGYRTGMRDLIVANAPVIIAQPQGFWQASLDLAALASQIGDPPWRLALTAVIEAKDGSKSYWSLAHPAGQPDFHHADCFAAILD